MNITELLSGVKTCECKREHLCPIKHVVIGNGVVNSIREIAKPYKNILLVADENTYAVGGESVLSLLGDKISARVIFSGKTVLVPNEAAIAKINEKITAETDLILGIGSGVINDLCKHTSYEASLPYHIVATAPSMDGYASKGSALILGGMKVTLNAAVPEAIVADTEFLKTAPMDMIIAGYGDIIGKYSCLCDWKLANLVNGEYICDFVLNATYEEVEKTRKLSKKLLSRDEDAIATLMGALVAVGILMAYVGNSRPASGSEHHFSHYFEIVGIVKGEKYLPHGIDVFYSAAETAKIREQLIAMDETDFACGFDAKIYESNIRRVYGSVADEVLALQKKLGWYEKISERLSVYKEKWQEIKALLKTAPSFSQMCEMLSDVGMAYSRFVDFYGEEKIRDAYLYAKDLKDRYTVLWMYSDIFAG
jgi:glycerol-1-phosphate dehydrogenase [NAD(P)+]